MCQFLPFTNLVCVLVRESLCPESTELPNPLVFMKLSLANEKHQQEIRVRGGRGIKLFLQLSIQLPGVK